MRPKLLHMVGVLAGLALFLVTSTKAAKFAGDPFSLGVGARGLALGGAVVAGPFDGTAPYWNPAGMNSLNGRYLTAMHAETFGSLLNNDFVAYVHSNPDTSRSLRAFGFYFYYLGGGGIKITAVDEITSRYYVLREESHADVLLAGAISGKIFGHLDFGVALKVIHRDIGTETGKGLTLDAGILYPVHRYLTVGMMVTDISSGFIRYTGKTFDQGAHTESIYPTLKPAFQLVYPWRDFVGRLLFTGDIKFENLGQAAQYHAGSMSLDTHWGLEIGWRQMLFGRAGAELGRFTVGGGLDLNNITVDLAYLHHSDLDETFRVSAGYRWGL